MVCDTNASAPPNARVGFSWIMVHSQSMFDGCQNVRDSSIFQGSHTIIWQLWYDFDIMSTNAGGTVMAECHFLVFFGCSSTTTPHPPNPNSSQPSPILQHFYPSHFNPYPSQNLHLSFTPNSQTYDTIILFHYPFIKFHNFFLPILPYFLFSPLKISQKIKFVHFVTIYKILLYTQKMFNFYFQKLF